MRIIFVRHGDPDYKNDCLTERGRLQAAACAERLAAEPITRVFSSSNGRAAETASYIAAHHGLTVECFDYMRELGWKMLSGEPLTDGLPWHEANAMVERGMDLLDPDWATKEPLCRNSVTAKALAAAEGFDALLATFGYRREGRYYRVLFENNETVVMASHGGSGSAVLAHLLALPFPFVLATLHPAFTSISILELSAKVGSLITPSVEVLNDALHIRGIEGANQYQ